MATAAARPALVALKQGYAEPRPVDEGWDDDMPIPIVNPAEILTVGSGKQAIRFNVDQMCTLAGMVDVRKRWAKLGEVLRSDREGTLFDVTANMINFEDQAALTQVRTGELDVRTEHVFMALRGVAEWPTVLSVEAWLRDAIMIAERAEVQSAAVTLWCLVVAEAVGEEGIRDVFELVGCWAEHDLVKESCSGGASEMLAAVAVKMAFVRGESLWVDVMIAVDEASVECFWDWRRVEKGCRVHPNGKCVRPPYRGRMSFGGVCAKCDCGEAREREWWRGLEGRDDWENVDVDVCLAELVEEGGKN